MIVQKIERGYWLATGNGPLRAIAAEGKCRSEAMRAYGGMWTAQLVKREFSNEARDR